MEMTGERQLAADRATVWAMLNDREVLKACVPGCESMVATAEHSFDVEVNAVIGPVKARFKGKMSMTDVDPPQGYKLRFEGQSAQAGFARGEANIRLEVLAPASTKLRYAASAQIGGKLAQVGSRLVDAAAGATADKFFEAFAGHIAARTAAAGGQSGVSPPPQARLGFWSWLVAFFRHLFSRR
jgi:carbon monoxide dehydrogenase subunit G